MRGLCLQERWSVAFSGRGLRSTWSAGSPGRFERDRSRAGQLRQRAQGAEPQGRRDGLPVRWHVGSYRRWPHLRGRPALVAREARLDRPRFPDGTVGPPPCLPQRARQTIERSYLVVPVGLLPPQALHHLEEHLVGDAGVVHQQRLDLPGDEREADRVGLGSDVGRSWSAVQDRDLAEEPTRPHRRDPLAVADHFDVAFFDDVQSVPAGAGLDDRGACVVALLLDQLAEHLQLLTIEPGKEGDLSQRLRGISLDRHRFLLPCERATLRYLTRWRVRRN